MIQLNYQTDNPRWGWSGVKFMSWEGYAKSLGYLANVSHYRNNPVTGNSYGLIELHVERNDVQGAWGKEGRIHYYGNDAFLNLEFPDWYNCKSEGVGNITSRINSNDYMYSLVNDFGFQVNIYAGFTTADIFPPITALFYVWNCLMMHLVQNVGMNLADIQRISQFYLAGWNK